MASPHDIIEHVVLRLLLVLPNIERKYRSLIQNKIKSVYGTRCELCNSTFNRLLDAKKHAATCKRHIQRRSVYKKLALISRKIDAKKTKKKKKIGKIDKKMKNQLAQLVKSSLKAFPKGSTIRIMLQNKQALPRVEDTGDWLRQINTSLSPVQQLKELLALCRKVTTDMLSTFKVEVFYLVIPCVGEQWQSALNILREVVVGERAGTDPNAPLAPGLQTTAIESAKALIAECDGLLCLACETTIRDKKRSQIYKSACEHCKTKKHKHNLKKKHSELINRHEDSYFYTQQPAVVVLTSSEKCRRINRFLEKFAATLHIILRKRKTPKTRAGEANWKALAEQVKVRLNQLCPPTESASSQKKSLHGDIQRALRQCTGVICHICNDLAFTNEDAAKQHTASNRHRAALRKASPLALSHLQDRNRFIAIHQTPNGRGLVFLTPLEKK